MNDTALPALLRAHRAAFGPVLPVDLNGAQVCRLDLTRHNPRLASADLRDTAAFDALIHDLLAEQEAAVGVGGYLENRVIYRRSALFEEETPAPRSLHLGVDIWLPAFTPVLAPLAGRVHSFQDNHHFGDYGPTIILEHELADRKFYTLYGHLTRASLCDLQEGQEIRQGQEISQVGPFPENGDWPPHLHFQLMADMLDRKGDFPGVCIPQDQDYFAGICLDPNIILQCRLLDGTK